MSGAGSLGGGGGGGSVPSPPMACICRNRMEGLARFFFVFLVVLYEIIPASGESSKSDIPNGMMATEQRSTSRVGDTSLVRTTVSSMVRMKKMTIFLSKQTFKASPQAGLFFFRQVII